MTINDIYELALYIAEKTDDNNGFIDSEYKKQHQKKAEIIIKQAIRKYANLQNILIPDVDSYNTDDEIPLPDFAVKNIIPCYAGAMLCAHDKETDKYNLLIYEYQTLLGQLKSEEEGIDIGDILSGLE